MQNRVTKRYWSYRSRGFALPSVLIAVTIFFAILATSCAALTSTNRSMREEWFTSAARHAAESGLAQAKACIAKSNGTPQWTSAKPLRPGLSDNSCAGSATACTTIPKCYVVAEGSLRSSYVVSVPEITANGDSYTISVEGIAAIISGGVVSDTRKVIIKQTGGRSQVKFSPDINISPVSGNALFLSDKGQVYQAISGGVVAPKLVGGALANKAVVQFVTVRNNGTVNGPPSPYSAQYALTSDGTVYSWGDNSPCDKLGNGLTDSAVPVAIGGALAGKVVTKIAASEGSVWVLTSDGAIYAWGCNSHGQLGNGTTAGSAVPVPVTMTGVLAGKTITAIYPAGETNVIVLASDGTLYGWGANGTRLNGNGSSAGTTTLPSAVSTSGVLMGKTIAKVDQITNGIFAIDINGKVYVWGSNMYGSLGVNPYRTLVDTPLELDMSGVLAGKSIIQVAGAYSTNNSNEPLRAYALSSDGNVYGWGKTATNGVQTLPVAIEAPSGVSFTQICVDGSKFVYAVSTAGALYRAFDMLSAFLQVDPSGVLSAKRIEKVVCSYDKVYAVSTEGRLYTWTNGSNSVQAVPSPVTWQLDGIVH